VYEQIEHNAAGSVVKTTAQTESCCFVIDDDAGIRKALCFTLRKLGLAPHEIATPAALDHDLAEHSPVLVFLDLGLGEHGALDVLPILARHGCRAPVQLMSGRSQAVLDEVVAAGEKHGLKMLPALTKPFRMGVIKDLVAKLTLPVTPG
jgi:DNA-binding NtrC family response regulator